MRLVEHPDDAAFAIEQPVAEREGGVGGSRSRPFFQERLEVIRVHERVEERAAALEPLLDGIAEQLLGLGAHVERRRRVVARGDVGHHRELLHEASVSGLGGSLLVLRPDDLGQIADRAGEEGSPATFELRDRELRGERGAVLPERG